MNQDKESANDLLTERAKSSGRENLYGFSLS